MPRPPLQFASKGAVSKRVRHQISDVSTAPDKPRVNSTNTESTSTSIVMDTTSTLTTVSSTSSDSTVKFLQESHARALLALQREVDALKAENSDLRFRIVMRDSTASSEAETIMNLQKQLSEAQEEIVSAEREKDELRFDLREARKNPKSGGDGPAGQAVDVASLKSTIKAQAAEIALLRANAKQHGASIQNVMGRSYAPRRHDVKQRRLSSEDLISLAEQRRRARGASGVEDSHSQLPTAHALVSSSDGDMHRHKPLPRIGKQS